MSTPSLRSHVSDASRLYWLGAAFLIAWLLIGGYVVRLWRAQRDLARKLDQLEKDPRNPPG